MMKYLSTLIAVTSCLLSAPPAQAEPLTGKVAVYSFPDSVWWEQWITFQSKIESNPDFDLVWYLRGELGSEQQLITGARRNRIQIISVSSQGMTSLVPEMGVLLAPYVFDSIEEADFVLDNYLAAPIRDFFSELDLEVIHFTDVGWTALYTVDQPVLVPSDLQGMTLRISPSIILQSFVEAVGADYVALELGELVPALQTGMIQGGLSNIVFIQNALNGQVCCATRLKGMYEMGANFANKRWLASATEDQKAALIDSYDSLDVARPNVRAYVEGVVKEGEASGMSYFGLTPEQRKLWKEASASGLQRILDDTGADGARLYDLLLEGKAAFQRSQETEQ